MPPFVVVVYAVTVGAVLAYAYSLWARQAQLRRNDRRDELRRPPGKQARGR